MTRALILSLLVAPLTAWADPTIDDVAPADSLIVFRVQDAGAMMDTLRELPLWSFIETPAFREHLDEWAESDENPLSPLGLTLDELPWPTGPVGAAGWESADTGTGMLLMADFGDGAEDAMKILTDLFAQKEQENDSTTLEIDDEDVYTLTVTPTQEALDEWDEQVQTLHDIFDDNYADSELTFEEFMSPYLEYLESNRPAPVTFVTTLVGTTVVFSDTREAVERALDAAAGHELESVAGIPALLDARRAVGDAPADVVVMADHLFDEGAPLDLSFYVPDGFLQGLGLDQLRYYALGLHPDSEDAQLEVRAQLGLTGTDGLFDLIGTLDNADLPAFVSPDAAQTTAFSFRFDRVIPLARASVMALDEEVRAEAEAGFTAFSLIAGPVLATLGPEVYLVGDIARPLSPSSLSMLLATRVSGEAPITGLLNQYAPMTGIEAREFLGHQIWDLPEGLNGPMAVSLGAGWAFFGATTAVEDALRRLDADAHEPPPGFVAATAPLAPAASAYSFARVRDVIELLVWQAHHTEEVVRHTFQSWDPDEDMLQSLIEEQEADPMMTLLRTPGIADVLINALGDSSGEARFNDEGVAFRALLLRPQDR